jgi:hypothetical protein
LKASGYGIGTGVTGRKHTRTTSFSLFKSACYLNPATTIAANIITGGSWQIDEIGTGVTEQRIRPYLSLFPGWLTCLVGQNVRAANGCELRDFPLKFTLFYCCK